MPALPRAVLIIAYPGVGLLDLAGAQTVLWAATRVLAQRRLPGYRPVTLSLAGGLLRTAEGLEIETCAAREVPLSGIDTLIVPGAPEIERLGAESAELLRWIAEAGRASRRTASVCQGAVLLAEAGLLQAWDASIPLERGALVVQQGRLWTSASGVDLALALVEADGGRDVAVQVARELAVALKRSGDHGAFGEPLHGQGPDCAAFDELHRWLADNLAAPNLRVEALAEHCHMSPRNFSRLYKLKTGRSPAKAVSILRLEAARRLLEDSDRHIDQIARQCGFGDEERMRTTFQRHLATSPRGYRKLFSR